MQENFELMRDVAEHNAMFMNPDGVQQVRDNRENTFVTPDEDFSDLLEKTFGRRLPNKNNEEAVDVMDVIKNEGKSQFLDFDFDDIKFTPFK